MASPEPSATEKAEQRRQRILAKRSARMAYASGDRSARPSQAPSEAVAPPPLRAAPEADRISAPSSSRAASAGLAKSNDPSPFARSRVSNTGSSMRTQRRRLPDIPHAVVIVPLALIMAFCNTRYGTQSLPFSPVQTFLQVEALLRISSLFAFASHIASRGVNLSLSGIAQNVGGLLAIVKHLSSFYQDAMLYMFVFLVGVRVLTHIAGTTT